ncbi:MAG: hypothetical protein ACLFO5_01150 [Opitutales bacterium]
MSDKRTSGKKLANRLPVAVRVVLITLVFAGAYFGLRNLPDTQCGFLHYDTVVNAEGEVEFCATQHASFLDLTRLKYPVEMKVELSEDPKAGKTVDATLKLRRTGGAPLAPHELAVTHDEKMHLMIVDPTLEDYHHVHPKPAGSDGDYRFSFTPERTGRYRLMAEVVPARSRQQAVATEEIEVPGQAGEPEFNYKASDNSEGLDFALNNVPERIRAGRDYRFELQVKTEAGAPAQLETIMGAKGHMVAFDAGRRGYAHMHPESSLVAARAGFGKSGPEPAGNARPAFVFNPPDPGWYRLFAQVQVDGREVFAHFDLRVE